ncbi:hypothetical protein M3G03_01965 [Aestuariimicrobium sp. p3-SID1156]|uniref:hypothetical protein n=1 Tax=Aestuariimicrobium sp. p3-SID1156 TaxID=2916038 RepID=UPI00223AAA40|nr:hypothetical protein [Aestuariimicrobium sp. p3-SID1156]MCT1458319.1 hypothetical protein [Aestuariimicrobium sp. p3-SID1156]
MGEQQIPHSQPTAPYPQPTAPIPPQEAMLSRPAETGPAGTKTIQTFPPLPEPAEAMRVSPATGQPRRDPVMLVGAGFLYASTVATAVGFGFFWWEAINIIRFHESARLLSWTTPRPGSWQSVVWVCVIALVALAVAAGPSIAAFQAWNGWRWSRPVALIAAGLSLLAFLLHPIALVAIPLAMVGAGVLWLPPVKRYFDHWAAFRAEDIRHPQYFDRVRYGPLDRYVTS